METLWTYEKRRHPRRMVFAGSMRPNARELIKLHRSPSLIEASQSFVPTAVATSTAMGGIGPLGYRLADPLQMASAIMTNISNVARCRLERVDVDRRLVVTENRRIPYDYLIRRVVGATARLLRPRTMGRSSRPGVFENDPAGCD